MEQFNSPEVIGTLGAFAATVLYTLWRLIMQGGQIQTVQNSTSDLGKTIQDQALLIASLEEKSKDAHAYIQRLENDAIAREQRHRDEIRRIEDVNIENHHAQELQLEHQKGRVEELSQHKNTYLQAIEKNAEERTRLLVQIEDLARQIENLKLGANKQGQELEAMRQEKLTLEQKVIEHTKQIEALTAENQQLKTENMRLRDKIQLLEGARSLKETSILADETPTPESEQPAHPAGFESSERANDGAVVESA